MVPVSVYGSQTLFKRLKLSLIVASLLNMTCALSNEASPLAVSKLVKDKKRHLSEYLKLQQEFNKAVCKPGTEDKYWELYRDFRGDGHYIPVMLDGKLDKMTVSRFVPEIESKAEWIASMASLLSKKKNLSDVQDAVATLDKRLQKALSLKEKITFAKNDKERALGFVESKYSMISLKDAYNALMATMPFLVSYKFPVDHFQLRENYDDVKFSEDVKEVQRKNEVYFFRKIVQDGAQNPDNSGSDSFMRAAFDTLAIDLQNPPDILTENLRHDLEWVIKAVDNHISRYGKEKLVKRLNEWEERTKRELAFYIALKNDRVQAGDHFETSMEILSRKEKARYLLKDYVLSKQKEVYEFWAKQSLLNRALFSLETILFNEVGRFDGSDALERMDVAQVVLNRVQTPHYNSFLERDSLYSYLSQHHKKHQKEYPWLNVMLKEGEFSFTYFFITGSVRIFCPEQTRIGKALIKENVRLSLDILESPNHEFDALRYFSRASMLGKISMDKLWSGYTAIEERPGKKLVKTKARYQKLYKAGKLNFLYEFSSPKQTKYYVYESGKTKIVIDPKSGDLYTYRSPHFFKYFKPINKLTQGPKKP